MPQASIGYSPFDLVYSCSVQGLLDLLKRSWEAPESTITKKRNIFQYVRQMRDGLKVYREQAGENLQKAQKLWYDHAADVENISLDRGCSCYYYKVQTSYWQSGKGHTLSSGRWTQSLIRCTIHQLHLYAILSLPHTSAIYRAIRWNNCKIYFLSTRNASTQIQGEPTFWRTHPTEAIQGTREPYRSAEKELKLMREMAVI